MKARITIFLLIVLAAMPLAGQQDIFAPGDNLVVEGIPPIPAALAADVDQYGNFRSAAISSWHPTKREMLIGTRFADTLQVHLVKSPGGARTQLTFFRDAARGALFQPADGESFIYSKDRGGDEFYQIYRYDVATGGTTLLTDGKSRNTGAVWSNAGDRLIYGSTRRDGQNSDLYIVSPDDVKSDHSLAELHGGGWGATDWSPDDRTILVLEGISANESYLWFCDAATGKLTALTPHGEKGEQVAYNGGQFSKDGKGIYTVTDKDSEFSRLAYIDLATKQHTYLTDKIHWDVEEFRLSKDGKKLAFVTNEDGISVLHVMDTATRQELSLPKLPVGVISGLNWHNNSRDLAFDEYGADAYGRLLHRCRYDEVGAMDLQRDRRNQYRRIFGAAVDSLEEFRWQADFRILVRAAREIYR
jgi:dipeptidyl aminopeptidase/acylaminoacyl peptidase